MLLTIMVALPLALASATSALADTFLEAHFDTDADAFIYQDDTFRATAAPAYASGSHLPTGGETGGGLSVVVGGVDDDDIFGQSGGFTRDFVLASDSNLVTLSLRYDLTQTSEYESDEFSQVMVRFDGVDLAGAGPDFVDQVTGNGNGGGAITTGWATYSIVLGDVSAGTHTLVIGAYNNKKTLANESTTALFDDVLVTGFPEIPCLGDLECDDGNACTDDICNAGTCSNTPNADPCDDGVSCTGGDVCSAGTCSGVNLCLGSASCNAVTNTCEEPATQRLVDALDLQNFKDHIETLSSTTGPTGGSRHWSQPGNAAALDYIEAELASYGYVVERHAYTHSSQTRENVYATKIGTTRPDDMYIVSAHMDSINFDSPGSVFAPGANDDGSGTSLVLEAARVFSDPAVQTERSIRFVLWNNEETGLNGSSAYVSDRRALQGIESPADSGLYPEPAWVGVIQHDMMMWDHGLPSGPTQIPGADNDIEYQASSSFATESLALANLVNQANVDFAPAYPGEVTDDMCCTDSVPFQNDVAAISVRENRRRAEIGNGSNPNWHSDSDVFETYSEADFALGFNALQATVGAVARLAQAVQPTTCGDGALDVGEECDDGNTTSGDCCSAFCGLEPLGSECRTGTGTCDPAEVCDGVTPTCPADALAPFGTTCRASAGGCDLEEVCDGASATCPTDAKSTAECRATAGLCDPAEFCDGVSDDCPVDVLESSGTLCRGAAGVCDVDEVCDGATAACPADAVAVATTLCRAAVGNCDVAESCDGVGISCPVDEVLDGVSCSDGDACTTGDLCVVGVCTGPSSLDCDDQDPCTADACDAITGCSNDPIAGCSNPSVPTHSSPIGWLLTLMMLAGSGIALVAESPCRDRS